jgi:hypothetical protein
VIARIFYALSLLLAVCVVVLNLIILTHQNSMNIDDVDVVRAHKGQEEKVRDLNKLNYYFIILVGDKEFIAILPVLTQSTYNGVYH